MADQLQARYTVRRPRLGDLSAVHALIAASDIAEFGESSGCDLAELEDDWGRTDLEHDAWVVVDADGEIAGYGYVMQRKYVRIDVEVYVHPAHVGRGIGTTLVRRAEERAREFVPQAPPEARVVLQNWINALNADACSLLEREGYTPVRYFWRMETELASEPEPPVWPDGITVRSAAAGGDLRPFYEASEAAMADHWGHIGSTFEEWTKRSTGQNFEPRLWFLAMGGSEAAAVALCNVSEGIGWVGTLAVLPAWRRRGLGTALLRHAFGEFHRRGLPRVGLGVDAESPTGATRLYERAGMRVTQQYAAYGKELRAGVEVESEEDAEADM